MKIKDIMESTKDIIKKRLINVPVELETIFPSILFQKNSTIHYYLTDRYLSVSFVHKNMLDDITKLKKQNFPPFIGLIANTTKDSICYKLGNCNNFLKNSYIKKPFGFFIEKNSSLIIDNFTLDINIPELGHIKYTIDLAYLISFGKIINKYNVINYLDNLIAYSVKMWKSS